MSALVSVVDAGPQSWNDDLGRSQNDVLAALTAALHRVSGEQTAILQRLRRIDVASWLEATSAFDCWTMYCPSFPEAPTMQTFMTCLA